MARRIIQPDLEGRVSHERLTPAQERLASVRSATRWLTIPGCLFSAVMVATHVLSVMDHPIGWSWLLLSSLGLAAAFVQSAVRLKWQRWSWAGFIAALAAHGYGMYRSYVAFADDPGVMEVIPETEMLLLAALLVVHGLWSLLQRITQQQESEECI